MRGGRAYAPGVRAKAREGPVQHACQSVDEVAAAEEVNALCADGEAAVGLWVEDTLEAVGRAGRRGRRQVRFLRVVVVVENDLAPRQIIQVRRVTGDARRGVFGELPRPAALIQLDLAEAPKLEILRDGQRVGEGHEHPFARLVEGVYVAGDWQIDDSRS